MAEAKETDILTVEEVAEMLRVTPSWVRAHANRSRQPYLPAFKAGKYVRFQRGCVLAAVQRWHRDTRVAR